MGKHLQKQYSFRTDDTLVKKLNYTAKQNTRTRNQELEHILKEYIKKYEEENGEIIIDKEERE